jgi:hypothetical protein
VTLRPAARSVRGRRGRSLPAARQPTRHRPDAAAGGRLDEHERGARAG